MKKILIICVITIAVITVGDIIFQKKIDNTFNHMIAVLEEIDKEQNVELKKSKIDELSDFWEKYSMYFACYIEHVELEKIKSQYIVIKSGIDVEDTFFIHEEINRTINTIELIRDKKTLRIDNIL